VADASVQHIGNVQTGTHLLRASRLIGAHHAQVGVGGQRDDKVFGQAFTEFGLRRLVTDRLQR